MNKKVAEIRRQQWFRTVHECINRNPRISKRQWCEKNGIKIRSLMYWQRKLQMEALEQVPDCRPSLAVQPDQLCAPAFADISEKLGEIQMDQDRAAGHPDGPAVTPELMIQAGAYRIYVNGSVQTATLETVMKVLSRA